MPKLDKQTGSLSWRPDTDKSRRGRFVPIPAQPVPRDLGTTYRSPRRTRALTKAERTMCVSSSLQPDPPCSKYHSKAPPGIQRVGGDQRVISTQSTVKAPILSKQSGNAKS